MLNIGDIFHCSWGYNMSINDFYEVVAISPTGKTCTIRPLRTRTISGDAHSAFGAVVAPVLEGEDRFADAPMKNKRVRVSHYRNGASCSISITSYSVALLTSREKCEKGFYENHND